MGRYLPFILFAVILSSCMASPTEIPTRAANGPTPITETATPEATRTATPEPTPTKEAMPARWDDPETLADVRAEFEAATGMSVEDYYNKAVDDGLVTVGISKGEFSHTGYATATFNGIGLGSRVVEVDGGSRWHLVVYFARRSGDGVGVYPLDVAIEENGVYAQTAMDSFIEGGDFNAYIYPVRYASVSEAADKLNQSVMGNLLIVRYPVRFRSLSDCSLPQTTYLTVADDGYWNYMQELCLTDGVYLNTLMQERIDIYDGHEFATTYNIDAIMEQGVPDGGLVVTVLGIKQR